MPKKFQPQKKLRIGWFTFSCCEDSTIVFTELLNDHWQEWRKLLDVRHARVLQSNNVLDELDVAFVEGALNSQRHVDMVKEIRAKSKKLVAIGSCACTGLPSTQRNTFTKEQTAAIQPLLDKFAFLPKGQKLAEVVKVDIEIGGCPMDEKKFLAALDSLLKEFKII
jgi:sulfhydrogenase subunit delta